MSNAQIEIENMPTYCGKSKDLPRRAIYSALRDIWLTQTGLTNKDLSALLDTTPQSCSTMATGSDRRLPPWWIILRLCYLTSRELKVSPNGVEIIRVPNTFEISEV